MIELVLYIIKIGLIQKFPIYYYKKKLKLTVVRWEEAIEVGLQTTSNFQPLN